MDARLSVLSAWLSLVLSVTFLGMASAQPADPPSVERAGAGDAGLWQLRSRHLVWGMPRPTDDRHNVRAAGETGVRPGISVLVREGFVVGHYDLYKEPAWVAVCWTREDHDNLQPSSFGRPFGQDPELPAYARGGDDYDYSSSHMERGHMARHEDNEAWGEDNSNAGCLMSNVVPQHKDMNGEAWNDLEDLHQAAVVDMSLGIDRLWVISGPVFEDTDGDGIENPIGIVGNGVAIPQATYKVIGWFGVDGQFNSRGYIVRQEDRIREPAHYLRPIDEIEAATGLDFWPELPQARATEIESAAYTTLWGGAAAVEEGAGQPQVMIASLVPNPAGEESREEAITLRNMGTTTASVTGWRLRDAAGAIWTLAGEIEPGDERTFRREGQAMALNNGGDTVELLDAIGNVIDRVAYGIAAEGQVLDAAALR